MSLRRFTFAFLLAVLAVPAQAQFTDANLVAHYPFEGNATDATTNDYNGTALGAPAYGAGVLGRALSLDGVDDAVEFRGIPASTFSGDFSMAWFMNLNEVGDLALIDKRDSCTGGNWFEIRQGTPTSNDIAFQLSSTFQSWSATHRLEARQWVHVAVVRDRSVARIYVDGKPTSDVALGTLSLGSIAAPLGIATSPCIGRGLVRPAGRMDELRVYSRALTATEVVKLSKRPGFSVTPGSGSAGASISATATQLAVGRSYALRLVNGGATDILLATNTATTSTHTWKATIPNVASGSYQVQLRSSIGRAVETREAPFTVVPRLTVTPATTTPQAGKSLVVDVGSLVPGALRLVYGNRVVAGPVTVDTSTRTLKFVLPTDYPTSFPATVTLRAELLDGRVVARTGSRSLSVSAPYTGPFIRTTAITTTSSAPREGTKIQLGSRLTLEDDTTAADLEVSAYFVADDGRVTPLPTSALALEPDGDFRLDTYPPSIGAMTAYSVTGPGRLRLVSRRFNKTTGRLENIVTDGPTLSPTFDTDPQTDIRVTVRGRDGNGTRPLEGAYVILDGDVPFQMFSPPPPPPGDTTSGFRASGISLMNQRQPQRQMQATQSALNQISELDGLQPFPPECGSSLARRYTNADGQVEFLIQGGPEDPGAQLANSALQYTADDCEGAAECQTVQFTRTYKFFMTVYTLHLGAGERSAGQTDAERPSRFEITYEQGDERFTIKNLKTGATSVQLVSANIVVEVPFITASGALVTIGDPAVFQQVGPSIYFMPRLTGDTFGRWVDFSGSAVYEFLNGAPEKVIRFPHKPDAGGSIVSAKLYLANIITGVPSFIGDFRQISFVSGCNLQDDPNANDTESWELRIDNSLAGLAQSWRFPEGVFFRAGAPRKSCGYIEAINGQGGRGRRNICFEWQKPPEYFFDFAGELRADDSDPNNVLVEVSGQNIADRSTSAPAPDALNGEAVEVPGRLDNRTTSTRSTFDILTSTGSAGATRLFTGNNPDQFSQTAGGANDAGDFAEGASVLQIGSDEFNTIFDQTIPLFQWYWGVPEILSAEVYARLRLLAGYYFFGTLKKENGRERLDLVTDAVFAAFVIIGVDIDILFGVIVDAGASITGTIASEIPVVVENNEPQPPTSCFSVKLDFYGYVDPCTFCPTPVIEFGDNIIDHRDPTGCGFAGGIGQSSPLLDAKAVHGATPFGAPDSRALRRHPALAFDTDGFGHALTLDGAGALTATAMSGKGAGGAVTLSNAPGARQSRVVYYDAKRAIAVWHESALARSTFQASDYRTIARNQRIAYSTFDGETWSARRFLTAAGTGEAHIALAACHADDARCPAGGEVVAVWQRNESTDAMAPRHRLKYARYVPGDGWTAIADVATDANVQDITPAVAYVDGFPAVVWSRATTTSLDDFTTRRLAYRVIGRTPAATITNLPAGAVAPSIVETLSGGDFRIAYTRTLGADGPIGTQQALHFATATCASSPCTFTGFTAQDEQGRAIYGERPLLVPTGNGDATIVMRTFRFGDDSPVRPGDALGTVLGSGDLMAIQPDFPRGRVRVAPISADGAMHFGHTAAFDPASASIVTAATTYVPPALVSLKRALQATGPAGVTPVSKALATVGGVEIRAMPSAPDFVIESLTTSAATVAPGASLTATLVLGNHGTDYVSTRDGTARIELRFDLESGPALAQATVLDIAGGVSRAVQIPFTVPAGGHADEQHVLYAVVVPDESLVELSGANNMATREFAGLPVPQALASSVTPGIATVQLGWEPSADPRVAGYRVYSLVDGAWMPLGASPTHGFLDLAATFNVPRTYAVATYSARGVESARSEAITVMPTLALANELFLDGFENP